MKFNRSYELHIELDRATGETIIIRPPLTVEFGIIRGLLSSVNEATISIINLAEKTRRRIFQDRYDLSTYRRVIFKAGYGADIPIVFRGNLRQAYSALVGTEWKTTLNAFDAGFAIVNGFTNITLPEGTTEAEALDRLMSSLPETLEPQIGDFNTVYSRGVTISGNTWQAIRNIVGQQGTAFIDNEVPRALKHNEALTGYIAQIDAKTGLLDTPRRQDARVDIRVLFEPYVVLGQIIDLKSRESMFDGQYKVIGINHSGVISETVGGQFSTSLSLWLGTQAFRLLQGKG
jgi:hypothetical protein